MKNFKRLVILTLTIFCSMFVFSACNNEENRAPEEPQITKYEIVFVVNDNIYSVIESEGNEYIALPSDPSISGYTFNGWYFDENVWQNRFTSTTYLNRPLNENVAVYAYMLQNVVTPQEFKINFILNNEIYSTIQTSGLEVINLPVEPAITGYSFEGWYFDKDVWQIELTSLTFINAELTQNKNVYAKMVLIETEEDNEEQQTDFVFEEFGNGYALKQYIGSNNTVEVPSTYNNKPVIAIGTGRVDGLTLVGDGFFNCYDIESITLPTSIRAINHKAFANCLSLTEIKIPNCKTIGSGAFLGCVNLIEVELPNDCIVLKDSLFLDCKKLETIIVNAGELNVDTFSGCSSVKNITLGENVTNVVENIFKECSSLENLTMPKIDITFGKLFEKVTYSTTNYNEMVPSDLIGGSFTDLTGKTIIWQKPNSNKWLLMDSWYKIDGKDVLYQGEVGDVLGWKEYRFYGTIDGVSGIVLDTWNVPSTAKFNCYVVPKTFKTLIITNQQIDYSNEVFKNCPFEIIIGSKIKYDLDGGTNSNLNPKTYTKFDTVVLEQPTRSGYEFIGWTGSNGETPQLNVEISVGTVGEKSYKANWQIINYTIKYDLDGGEVSDINPVEYTVLSETITLINPSKIGYEFAGWLNEDTQQIYEEITLEKGSTGDLSLIAQWTIINYSINYEYGCWVGELENPTTYTVEDEIILQIPVNSSVEFLGWYNGDANIAEINKGSTGNLNLIANWNLDNNLIYKLTETECIVQGVQNNQLASIQVPNYVTTLSSTAFLNCANLINIIVPDSITKIEIGAFSGCTNLESLTLPFTGDVEGSKAHFGYIFGRNFYSNSYQVEQSVFKYYIPNSLKDISINTEHIPENVFSHSRIDSLTLSNKLLSIGASALRYSTISTLNLDNSINLTTIGEEAFYSCSNLKNLNLSGCSSLTTIGKNAFSYCYNLTNINLNNCKDLTTIEESAFSNCSSLSDINFSDCANIFVLNEYTFSDCTELKNIILPKNLEGIGENVFYNCGLESIIIPQNVREISDKAFYNCSTLTSISVDENNSIFDSRDNCNAIVNTETKTLITACKGTLIPDTIEHIGSCVFENFDWLTTIQLPNSVKTIGDHAFDNCPNLASINLPTNLTTIGDYSFRSCINLGSIEFPNSLTEIGDYAFYNCDKLTSIEMSPNVTNMVGYAFAGCDNLKSADFSNCSNLISFGSYAFGSCINLTDVILPNSLEFISEGTFSSCYKLENINLASCINLRSIGVLAFSYCSNITSVDLQNTKIHSINNQAFQHCTNLTNLKLPTSISNIGGWAFISCENLVNVDLSNFSNLKVLNESVFANCTKLETLNLENCANLTEIDERAFAGCSNLKNLNLNGCDSLKSIGENAFINCASLLSLDFSECSSLKVIDLSPFNEYGTQSYGNLLYVILPKSIKEINDISRYVYQFKIFYLGTEIDLYSVECCYRNASYCSCKSTTYFYIENEEDVPKNGRCYWHYDTDGVTPVIWNSSN